ncbi:unnamed protein product [Soboliphyme baturini]|uniref:Uncharacterized protein n=1 Tax=Soboliphyme baturini TaxID=241478 RepID=A0A183IJ12_9BILA|nr:unnamed protein product [Soboliphyme baturini]
MEPSFDEVRFPEPICTRTMAPCDSSEIVFALLLSDGHPSVAWRRGDSRREARRVRRPFRLSPPPSYSTPTEEPVETPTSPFFASSPPASSDGHRRWLLRLARNRYLSGPTSPLSAEIFIVVVHDILLSMFRRRLTNRVASRLDGDRDGD